MAQPKFKQAKTASLEAGVSLRMLRDQILVKPIDVDRHSGLVVIDKARKAIRAKVVAVGPGRRPIRRYRNEKGEVYAIGELPGLVPTELKAGEVVELMPARYTEYTIGGELHLLAKESDAAGVVP